jgi:thiamine-monophosphate kinase
VPPEDRRWLRERLDFPTPRVAAGLALAPLASAAIDLSDGLVSDLGHLVAASEVSAVVECARLPRSAPLRAHAGTGAAALALSAGDDYELLFTVSPEREAALPATDLGCPVTRIGEIEQRGETPVRWLDPAGRPFAPTRGVVHF